MSERVPPKFALWLLEQYQEGRSGAWFLGQVSVAIAIARARYIRTLPWAATTHRDACRSAACVCPGN